MYYNEFREKVKDYPFFRSNIFSHLTKNQNILRSQITGWVAKGYVIPLKRGLYTLREDDRNNKFSLYFLANNLYSPSYISLESALSYYGLIPEKVVAITSISPKKTQRFENYYGKFIYQHVKNALYDDYVAAKDEFSNRFFIASKERAIIDFLYLRTRGIENIESDIFQSSYRMQNLETIDVDKLKTIAEKFKQKKLDQLVKSLCSTLSKIK